MKLVAAKCPQCKADIQIDSESKQAFCMYCGTKILIEDEVTHVQLDNMENAGFEFERGRQQAKDIINTELANAINNELLKLSGAGKLEENNHELYDLLSAKSKIKTELKSWQYALPYWPAIIIFVLSFLISVSAQAGGWLFLGIIISAAYIYVYLLYSKRKKMFEKQLADVGFVEQGINEENKRIKLQLDKLSKENINVSIPTKYRTVDALAFFVDALKNGRASTMKECINLYEQEIVNEAKLAMLQNELIKVREYK